MFSAGVAGNLLGLEALKELTGIGAPSLVGQIAVLDIMDLSVTKHVVLRKPWCPACYAKHGEERTGAAGAAARAGGANA